MFEHSTCARVTLADSSCVALFAALCFVSDRPGNYTLAPEQQSKHTFPIAHTLFDVQAMLDQKARGEGPLHVHAGSSVAPAAVAGDQAAQAGHQVAAQSEVASGKFNTF